MGKEIILLILNILNAVLCVIGSTVVDKKYQKISYLILAVCWGVCTGMWLAKIVFILRGVM